jgi:ABC-type amino acid transport system permease subunit
MQWNDWVLLIAVIVMPFIGMRYRRWIGRMALTFVASSFWGMLFAGLVGWVFGLLGDSRLIFAALPASIAVAVWAWRRTPQILDQQIK